MNFSEFLASNLFNESKIILNYPNFFEWIKTRAFAQILKYNGVSFDMYLKAIIMEWKGDLVNCESQYNLYNEFTQEKLSNVQTSQTQQEANTQSKNAQSYKGYNASGEYSNLELDSNSKANNLNKTMNINEFDNISKLNLTEVYRLWGKVSNEVFKLFNLTYQIGEENYKGDIEIRLSDLEFRATQLEMEMSVVTTNIDNLFDNDTTLNNNINKINEDITNIDTELNETNSKLDSEINSRIEDINRVEAKADTNTNNIKTIVGDLKSVSFLVMKGAYDNTIAYKVGELVTFTKLLWVCIVDTIAGEDPEKFPNKWENIGVAPKFSELIYSKGIVYSFKNKQVFMELKSEYGILDTQYEIIFDTFLGSGESGAIVGNGIIKENNIVGKEWAFYSLYNANQKFTDRETIYNGKNISSYSTTLSNYYRYVGFDSKQFQNIEVNVKQWSFGVSNPIEFKPKYREVYRVIFNVDIYRISS